MQNLIGGIEGAEGPCVSRDGRVLMVGPNEGRVIEVLDDGQSREIANTGGSPAGLQIDRNNDLWCADMKRGVLRIGMEGTVYPEVCKFDGEPMRGCNDCYFDSKGNLYFTAPAGSSDTNRAGEVYCRCTDGRILRLDGGYAFSNGLAVSADDTLLIVAETFSKKLWAYDIEAPGVVVNKRLWSTLPAGGLGPDGMDFDADGNLLVAHFKGSAVEVFDAQGNWKRSILMPFEQVTNIHFRGLQSTKLLVTEMSGGGLWECEYSARGQMQYGWL